MDDRIAALESLGKSGSVIYEREGLVTHLFPFNERAHASALERRRSNQIDLGAGRQEALQQVRSDEAAAACHGDPASG
jgi:hypothetical protein